MGKIPEAFFVFKLRFDARISYSYTIGCPRFCGESKASNGMKETPPRTKRSTGVTDRESEEIFFNKPLVVARSSKGGKEIRYVALGKTYGSRLLTVVFTFRANRIRVISARPMSRNERKVYEKED